jgi:Baseplate J-like protein
VPLTVPNLDDLRWEDLVSEGRLLIPASAPDWTNHNPSDPGITLMELLAFVCEKLIYQLNRVSDRNVAEFLSLVDGPGWKERMKLAGGEGVDVDDEELHKALLHAVSLDQKIAAIDGLQEQTRAVTPADFETLACSVSKVARAKCISRRNLESDDPAVRAKDAPGHISVVILRERYLNPSRELLARIRQKLEPARLLTTRVHVVAPQYVTLGCRFTITPVRGVAAEVVRERAINRLNLFFDPYQGWLDGKGWPWGRSVYLSELYQVLGEINGVDSVSPTRDAQGVPQDEIVVKAFDAGRVKRNKHGEIEAVELHPDELIEASIDSAEIVTASPR